MKTAAFVCGLIGSIVGIIFSVISFIASTVVSGVGEWPPIALILTLVVLIATITFVSLQKSNNKIMGILIIIGAVAYCVLMATALSLDALFAVVIIIVVGLLLILSGIFRLMLK